MTSAQVAVIAVIVIAMIAAVVVIVLQNRTRKLRAQFGPEYDRAVAETGNRLKAEAELERVEKRVKRYPLRALTAVDRERFQQSWRAIQARLILPGNEVLDRGDEFGKIERFVEA